MKKSVVALVVGMVCCAYSQQVTLLDARAKITEAISDPAVMASTVQQLPADDQKKFIAEVNEAIAKMPGSSETRTANFLMANRAALKGARKGNLSEVLAEVFATVPLEALTVLNENFASDLFNRSADPSVTYTDEQYVKLAQDTLAKISARNAEVDDGAVRTGFAILMFTRASNGTPKDLADTLAAALPEDSREVAKKEWFPAALAEGENKSYDPMIGDSDVGLLPNEQVVSRIAHAQSLEALLCNLAAGDGDLEHMNAVSGSQYGSDHGGIGSGLDNGLYRLPFTYNRKVISTEAGQKGSGRLIGGGSKVPGVPGGMPVDPSGTPVGPGGQPVGPGGQEIEPGGYQWQR